MRPLKALVKVGTILGEGIRAYEVEKITNENIYLRGHPNAQRGENGNQKGALRIIPTIVIEDILHGIESKTIQLDDILRKRGDEKTDLFSLLDVDHDKFILGYDSTIYKICELCLTNINTIFLSGNAQPNFSLPKPFILLAGISGTGKTRFVKEQAHYFRADESNYQLVSVRPDWHEPSDLLGYISRLGNDGTKYIVTDFLQFIVAAWKNITEGIENGAIHYKSDSVPYWLCLDEMNLAPVEQYFADYLSVIETRHWDSEGVYQCSPLLNAGIFTRLGDAGLADLRMHLGLHVVEHDALWAYFQKNGISIPPNLIVAGTVNMDETTHGFSRKVIDRAFTLDFGEFFPNDYQAYFSQKTRVKALTYPAISQVDANIIADYDPEGQQSIAFLEAINAVLKGTPFELAYRALNELLIAVVCFMPKETIALQAVWDDFLMTKVLPRIEGDSEKLQDDGEYSLLTKLEGVLAKQLNEIWASPDSRPDFLREGINAEPLSIACRSKKKLAWMKVRLSSNGFTAFWP